MRTGFSGLVASSKTGGMGSAYSLASSCQMESDGLESEIRRLEYRKEHGKSTRWRSIGDDTPRWSTDYLGTAPSAPSAPIWARPLQGLRCRPFKLFELPAVYQPLPISIFRGRRDETIGIRIGIRRGRPLWLGCPGRGDLERPCIHPVRKSRQPRSSIARKMRSKWCHHIPDGMLLAACHTGVAICHSTDRR